MKKSLIFKVLAAISLVAMVILVDSFIGSVAGIGFATQVIAGGPVTEQGVRDLVTDLDMEDISDTVTEMNPARTPLDTILRKVRKAEKIESMIKKFYSVGSEPLTDTVTTGYTYASGDGITVRNFPVANKGIWAVDDTVLVRNVTVLKTMVVGVIGTPANEKTIDMMFYVDSIDSNGINLTPIPHADFSIKGSGANATKYVMPNIATSTVLYRMGVAKNELAIQHDPFALLPEPEYNYCQYFIAQVEESTFQKLTKKEVGWGFSDYERQNIYAMKAKMEMSFLNGVKSIMPNTVKNDKRYTTEGITRRIANTLTYDISDGNTASGITNDKLHQWLETVFTGNSGSQERILFGGSTLIRKLQTITSVEKQLGSMQTKLKWGVEVNEFINNFGKVYFYHHPLLSLTGWKDNGILLDMEHVRKHEFVPMKVTTLDLKTSGQRNADARVIAEASCLTLQYPDCHALILGTA